MPEVKWIKITTDMFDDEKIKLLEAMPDADMLLVIWVKLICQAGKVNANGYIFLSENLPYTEEQFATIFNRPVNTIRLALQAFRKLEMISIDDDGTILLPNFSKHQNTEGLEKIREQTRLRVSKHRLLKASNDNVTSSNVTVTQQNRIDKNRIDKNKTIFGEFNNVLLSDNELTKLQEKFGAMKAHQLIENLSEGIASKGYKYKDHYATILSWARRDEQKGGGNGVNQGHFEEAKGNKPYTRPPAFRP